MAVDPIARFLRPVVLVFVAVALTACDSSSRPIVSMADAGPDQSVGEGALVTLDGSGSTGSGALTYAWTQTAGTPVMLSNPTAVNPTFSAPIVAADEVLTFRLEVTDNNMNVAVDTVNVTIVNNGPTANAGPDQTVADGAAVALDGAGSSHMTGGVIVSYAWVQTAGPAVVLSDPTAVNPTFTAPFVAAATVLTFELTVMDDDGDTDTDTVDINVSGQVTVSGKVTFHEIPQGVPGSGLDYGSIVEMPARLVTVEVIDAADNTTVIASTTTDANGDYSVDLDPNINVFTRVRAEMVETGPAPSWNFRIVDNTSGDAQYVLDSADFNTGGADQIRDILAATAFDGNDYTSRNGAPFAILDAIHDAFQTVLAGDATIDFVPLDIHWSINNRSVFGDESIGEIGTSFYRGGNPPGGMFLLGMEDDDTEEYDQHVIIHEFGHYFEDTISRSDSIGGSHGPGDLLDMRVAFGEGWGYALSGIATGDPLVLDAFGTNQGLSGGFNVEDGTALEGPNPAPGWYSERSVQEILYDLMDSFDDGMDVLSLGFAPLYDVFVDQERTTDVFTSIFTFINGLKADRPGDAANIDALVGDQSIDPIADELGTGETNSGTPANADILPIYKAVVIDGVATNVCSTDAFGGGNKLGTNQYFQFTVPAADQYEFTATATTLAGLTDPDMRVFVFDAATENLLFIEQFDSAVVDSEVGTSNNILQPGTNFLLEVFEFNNRSLVPIGIACFDISIASTP